MSAIIPHCVRCDVDRVFVRFGGLGDGASYGVEWRCPGCATYILDLCPLGPLAPTKQSCLNCGKNYPQLDDFAACPGCGMTRLGVLDQYGLDPAPADPLARAEKYFDLGLIRRAMATLNQALVLNPALEPAWRTKYAFVSGLGFNHAALAIIEAATEFVVNPDLLISYAYLLRDAGRGEEARDVYREYLATAPGGEFAAIARTAVKGLDQALV